MACSDKVQKVEKKVKDVEKQIEIFQHKIQEVEVAQQKIMNNISYDDAKLSIDKTS